MKVGANKLDQSKIHRMTAAGKSADEIVMATQVNKETVLSFMKHFKDKPVRGVGGAARTAATQGAVPGGAGAAATRGTPDPNTKTEPPK